MPVLHLVLCLTVSKACVLVLCVIWYDLSLWSVVVSVAEC